MPRRHQPDEDETFDRNERDRLNIGFTKISDTKCGKGDGITPFGPRPAMLHPTTNHQQAEADPDEPFEEIEEAINSVADPRCLRLPYPPGLLPQHVHGSRGSRDSHFVGDVAPRLAFRTKIISQFTRTSVRQRPTAIQNVSRGAT